MVNMKAKIGLVGTCLAIIPFLLLYSILKFGPANKKTVIDYARVILPPTNAAVPARAHRRPPPPTSPPVNIKGPGKDRNKNGSLRINPGCLKKKLNKYRAVDTGRVYHHPAIIHYVKLTHGAGGRLPVSMNFREYTAVLSAYKFLHPERIIFHTYSDMTGEYWDKILREWKGVKIEMNKIEPVHSVGGKQMNWIQHKADYVKLIMLLQYGGISLDFDVVIVNATRLKRQQSLSECVISEEGDYINLGFQSCIKDSAYIKKWVEGYHKDYRPDLWLHNGSYKPAQLLLDKKSEVCYNVHLDDTICVDPNWGKQREWLKRNGVRWRSKTAAHYFVKDEISNDDERILKEHHSLADLLRYVHEA